MEKSLIIDLANTLSNADIAALINVLSDRLFVSVNDLQGQSDSVALHSVTGACLNGAMVQIEIEE